jgi:6-pyruvoyltetrahydropterin/6-carboxytetrahydropterin synthase
MFLTIRTTEQIAIAHFVHLANLHSKCRKLHGHNLRVEVTVFGEVKTDGMVVDFNAIKSVIKELDHKTLLPDSIANLDNMIPASDSLNVEVNNKSYTFPVEDIFILENTSVVTSENIASYLWLKFKSMYPKDDFTIRIYESENSFVEIKP